MIRPRGNGNAAMIKVFLVLCAGLRASAANVGLLFATMNGNTARVADYIGHVAGLDPIPIHALDPDQVKAFDHYIIGAPTYIGSPAAQQGRTATDWDVFLAFILKRLGSFAGKKVAVFGLGDQRGYPFQFCDAMDDLARAFQKQGAEIIGAVDVEGYDQGFQMSDAVWDELDGKFVGLPLDEANQQDLTGKRVRDWVAQLMSEGMPLAEQSCTRRRGLEAVENEEAWYTEWDRRISCWLAEGGASVKNRLQECAVAFGSFVNERAREEKGGQVAVQQAMPAAALSPEPGCEWISELELPSFPSLDVFGSVGLPELPRLVPWGYQKWKELRDGGDLSSSAAPAVVHAEQSAVPESSPTVARSSAEEGSAWVDMAAGVGIGFASVAAGAALVLGIRRRQEHSVHMAERSNAQQKSRMALKRAAQHMDDTIPATMMSP